MRLTRVFVVGALAISGNAQGDRGGPQTSCSSSEAFNYLGCYGDADNGDGSAHLGWSFQLLGSQNSGDVHYYPGYTTYQVNVDICLEGCRGHGFRYAGLYGATQCYCNTLAPTQPAPGSTDNGTTTYNACHVAPISQNGCQGDMTEWCGSNGYSDVFEDPSFVSENLQTEGSNYAYLGCYTTANPGDFLTVYTEPDTATSHPMRVNVEQKFRREPFFRVVLHVAKLALQATLPEHLTAVGEGANTGPLLQSTSIHSSKAAMSR
ncbi:MAG: hypothetical protein M1827_000908 [Pycnora praestabilis]|nr:MAG: hypothetical protein M1827_000908 [Pycnora praestabilis]